MMFFGVLGEVLENGEMWVEREALEDGK